MIPVNVSSRTLDDEDLDYCDEEEDYSEIGIEDASTSPGITDLLNTMFSDGVGTGEYQLLSLHISNIGWPFLTPGDTSVTDEGSGDTSFTTDAESEFTQESGSGTEFTLVVSGSTTKLSNSTEFIKQISVSLTKSVDIFLSKMTTKSSRSNMTSKIISGAMGTGESSKNSSTTEGVFGCSVVAIGCLRSSPLDHPFSLVCHCMLVSLRAAFCSVGLCACMSVCGAAQRTSRGDSYATFALVLVIYSGGRTVYTPSPRTVSAPRERSASPHSRYQSLF
ncbi:hypothetical protein EVAR_40906_1 [Eumeta japonica]|uniref:Uncharacterized protein n=1 Tax=Eumeta variegata TaxID=151549 RepID=A0A4C1X5A6_EUMVA|nr:hypothetical protein EVAR_40906_1 [Eumeta japonica]